MLINSLNEVLDLSNFDFYNDDILLPFSSFDYIKEISPNDSTNQTNNNENKQEYGKITNNYTNDMIVYSHKENNNQKPIEININKIPNKLGRRPKGSTKTGGHTSDSRDNLTDTCWSDFFSIITDLCNYYTKPYNFIFKKTNFKEQFGTSIVQNLEFIKIKLCNYFTYNPKTNYKYKYHREFGSHNKNIIEKMFEKDNKIFIALMKTDIESIYNKFINNNKIFIVNNKEYLLSEFKTVDELIEEKRKKLLEKNKLSNEDINKKINKYTKIIRNLIKYIKVDGNKHKRKQSLDLEKKINYPTIDLLEE